MSFYKEVPGRKTTLESTLKFDTTPTAGSMNPVTSGGVANAVTDVLDDHAAASEDEELTMPAAEAANYTVDNYFEQDGEIWKCTAKTDNGDGTWTVEAEKVNGIVPALNEKTTDADVQSIINNTPNIKNVQSDWNENDDTKDSFVKYRPIKTGLSYYSTTGNDCFLILRKNISTTASHVEQFSLNIRYSRSSNICITSEVNILLLVNKSQQTITFPTLINNIFANSSKNVPDWEILAEADFSNGVFSLYAKRVSGNYTTIEYMITSASSERSDLISNVSIYTMTAGETPATYSTVENRYSVYSTDINNINLDGIMTDDNGGQLTQAPPQQVYVTGKFYFVEGKVCRCTAYSAASATFDVYGVVEALNYVLGQT